MDCVHVLLFLCVLIARVYVFVYHNNLYCAAIMANKDIQGGPKKRGNRLITIILSNFNRFTQFFTERFMINLQLKAYLKSHRTLHI